MVEFSTVWKDNSPDSLVDIAIQCCIKNPWTLFCYNVDSDDYELQEGISLPREICDRIIQVSNDDSNTETVLKVLKLFQDIVRTRLCHVNVSSSPVTDSDLAIICRHNIIELNISKCTSLTRESFDYINRLKSSLLSLVIGDTVNIFPQEEELCSAFGNAANVFSREAQSCLNSFDSLAPDTGSEVMLPEPHCNYVLNAPRLRKLVVHGLGFLQRYQHFQYSLHHMRFLTYLDLSKCKDVGDLSYLANHKHMLSLILYNVPDLDACIPAIVTIKSLRHLDLSQAREHHVHYGYPNGTLKLLVENLEDLVSLDISGTNLAGNRMQEHIGDQHESERTKYSSLESEHAESEDELVTDIVGLKSRVTRPLEFLGLYNTAYESCYRHHIPAKKIAGDANEQQVLTAAQVYCHRSEIIQKVLNDLFHIFRFSSCNDTKLALDVVLGAMAQHMSEKHIQISGSASLFYIVKGEEKANFNVKIKKKIIKTLLDAMFAHVSDVTMVRNGCLTLIHFKIPEDMFFYYERLVKLLLIVVSQDDQDEFVQRISVYLLNSLACQVDGLQKQLVGDQGAITIMLQLIANRLSQQVCDEVMETAWSTLWNVTDETPKNCQRFLEGNGMALFLGCLKAFPEKPELLRNMMGLLGNVAEVKEQRPFLMKEEYISVFSELLSSKSDGIEVSYNAAGILSHIASDGPELWEKHDIFTRRQAVLGRMVQAIASWNLNTKRNINYRSFEPILRLLTVNHTPEAQYWAIWALANLTKVYPDRYCSILREEGGIELITGSLSDHPYTPIRDLANMTVENCER